MAIISQDAIKLGCSGGQGKIQIQTLLVLETPPGRACHPTCSTMVENPRQRRVNLYKLVRLWRDRPIFMQNKANYKTEVRKQKTDDG